MVDDDDDDDEAIEACDEVGSSGTEADEESGSGGGSGVEVRVVVVVVVVVVDDLLGERGGGAAVPFLRGGSGSDLSPSPYVNPAFSSRASMFLINERGGSVSVCVCVASEQWEGGRGKGRDGLGVDAEEFAVVVELLEPRVERGRFDGVGLLFEFGNHVEKDGGVALGLCVFRVPGTTKGGRSGSVNMRSPYSGRRRRGSSVCPALAWEGTDCKESDVKQVFAAREFGVGVLLLEGFEQACSGSKVGDAGRGRDAGAWGGRGLRGGD